MGSDGSRGGLGPGAWMAAPLQAQQGSERQSSTPEKCFACGGGPDRAYRNSGTGTDFARHRDSAPKCAHLCASLGVFEGMVCGFGGYGTQGAVARDDLGSGS